MQTYIGALRQRVRDSRYAIDVDAVARAILARARPRQNADRAHAKKRLARETRAGLQHPTALAISQIPAPQRVPTLIGRTGHTASAEQVPVELELEPELPADAEILSQPILHDGHAAPPSGYGSASDRRAA
jgi:hypothetical protein